jgi:hypothetical protein
MLFHKLSNYAYMLQFYNIVLFMSSVAVFSLVAQRINKANS